MKRCTFILETWGPPDPQTGVRTPPKYCGAKTRYKMVRDDDENKVRQYDHLCPEHRAWADAHPQTDEDDE